ncbi:hypothetical protein BDV41DRAFT_543674 [Aspergillus transmontanensis]|uniref:Uncharacterized protein n=1 Tax=Aspergillus transmontanensis TaxID=1034304 RepID=A0A5N6VQN1_9EURO|nr:hypothetical protein BDV41DRAFT_543674 [Aspergillus transmontanensis]
MCKPVGVDEFRERTSQEKGKPLQLEDGRLRFKPSHVPSQVYLLPQSGSPMKGQSMEYRLVQTMVNRRIYEESAKPQATRTISVAS